MIARIVAFASALVLATAARALAGPPFITDDPEPTDYRNWEIYVGADYENFGANSVAASAPFAELNYGLMPNVQISATLPLELVGEPAGIANYGFGGAQFGIKTRFVQETASTPQISFYPSVLTPEPGLGGHVVTFLPLWMQKSWGNWTAFGGGGLYLNPGPAQKNFTFEGGALERVVSPGTTLGIELFHQSATAIGQRDTLGANVGAIERLGPSHALLFSIGPGLRGPDTLTAYASYELQLGPHPLSP